MNKTILLIDEDSLGVDRFLVDLDIQILKVGQIPELPLRTDDKDVAKFAKEHKCIVVTRDDKLVKQCNFFEVDVITLGMDDLAKKVIKYLSKP